MRVREADPNHNIATIDFHHKRIEKLETEQCRRLVGTLDGAEPNGRRRQAGRLSQMLQLLENWQRKPLVDALMAFKGFKLVAAMVTVSEQHRRPGGVLDEGEAEG